MVSRLAATDIPITRTDVLHILTLNGDDHGKLSADQLAAIKRLYFLDSDISVEQRVREGSILSDDMETETEQINKFQRVDLP